MNSFFCFHPTYRSYFDILKRAVDICDMLGINYLEREKENLTKLIVFLETPKSLESRKQFLALWQGVKTIFDNVKDQIKEKISLLNSDEIDRLNEAIHCLYEGCYYSAVAMSVSAIEFRLFSLMTSRSSDSKLEELTLGQLIKEYLQNKQRYGNVIPVKHEPLLDHCNIYRIFSVHPKREEKSKPIASSILNMTFLFLLDKKLIEKVERES